jgi:hypothetical protein
MAKTKISEHLVLLFFRYKTYLIRVHSIDFSVRIKGQIIKALCLIVSLGIYYLPCQT